MKVGDAMSTKELILQESLKLFSVYGFDAVSTRMIAKTIHASNAVIYKHYKSKQEILDRIVEESCNRYRKKMESLKLENICWENLESLCMDVFQFQTTDQWITDFRKLLTIEQYKNPEMARLYRKFFIDGPIQTIVAMMEQLMKLGYIKEGNPEVYAMDFYGPFFLYHTVGGKSEHLLTNLREHVQRFRENVITDQSYLE